MEQVEKKDLEEEITENNVELVMNDMGIGSGVGIISGMIAAAAIKAYYCAKGFAHLFESHLEDSAISALDAYYSGAYTLEAGGQALLNGVVLGAVSGLIIYTMAGIAERAYKQKKNERNRVA